MSTLYRDHDGDGFGSTDQAIRSVGPLDGYVPVPGDCNDEDASVFPRAVDIPEDGVDQDCSGGDATCDRPCGRVTWS